MISVCNVSKKYEGSDTMALSNVNFTIEEGEIVGLIGRNGAGKSTLLKLFAKFIKPTTGDILYDNESIFDHDYVLSKTGILYEPVFYSHLSAYDNLKFYIDIHNLKIADKEIFEMLNMLGLSGQERKKPRDYSFGMKQRLGLAQALLGEPKTLFLDEPFVGLDPTGVGDLMKIIMDWAKSRKMYIIISSHQLYELSELCKRVLVLKQGVLVFDGYMDKSPEITITLDREYQGDFDGEYKIESKGDSIVVSIDDDHYETFLMEIQKRYFIKNMDRKESGLEAFFKE